MQRLLLIGMVSGGVVCAVLARPSESHENSDPPTLRSRHREPIALAAWDDRLYVGNRRSGTVSVIDLPSGRFILEFDVASQIADLVQLTPSKSLAVLDAEKPHLTLLKWNADTFEKFATVPLPYVGHYLAWDAATNYLWVSCQWSHRVLAFEVSNAGNISLVREILLPFSPGKILPIPARNVVIVADAFAGRLAVVAAETGKVAHLHEIPGHNIRGLIWDRKNSAVKLAHQRIHSRVRMDYEELHWGRAVASGVRTLAIGELLHPPKNGEPLSGWFEEFGGIGGALADPSDLVTDEKGTTVIAFAGAHKVVIQNGESQRQVPVGHHPGALLMEKNRLFVANRFDDSVSVIDLSSNPNEATISLGPQPSLTAEQRGERLFFDASLSHAGWLSCHSCHSEGHTSGLIVDTLGDGDYGAPKLVPTLLGTRDTQPWGWDGGAALLREQLQKSITTTMHGEELSARDLEDLFAYVTQLNVPTALPLENPALVKEGENVFRKQGCVQCHTPPAMTVPELVDVSLLDEKSRSQFNPPSLRGLSHRGKYFHDGRARTLGDVLLKTEHQLKQPLSPAEFRAISAYLLSL